MSLWRCLLNMVDYKDWLCINKGLKLLVNCCFNIWIGQIAICPYDTLSNDNFTLSKLLIRFQNANVKTGVFNTPLQGIILKFSIDIIC